MFLIFLHPANDSTRDAGALVGSQGFDLEADASRDQRLQRQERRARDVPLWAYRSGGVRRRCLRWASSFARVPVFTFA